MPEHRKPTTEELENGMNQALEALDKPDTTDTDTDTSSDTDTSKDTDTTTDDTTDTDTDQDTSDDTDSDTTTDDTSDTTDTDTDKNAADTGDTDELGDWKKRHTESTREAQILAAKNKKITQAMAKATETPEPTEEELKAEYPDWDDMTDTEKRLSKRLLWNEKKMNFIEEISKEEKDIEAWNGKVDSFTDDPETLVKFPELEGKLEEFKQYVTKPSHRNVDFEVLVSAFMHTADKGKPKNKGQMFETGGQADKTKPKPKDGKLSLEEGRVLRQTNYRKYVELLKDGKIANE